MLTCSVVSDPSRPPGLQPTRLLRPWDSLGKNTGVGCHCLLQGIYLTQGSNPGLSHCRQILYHLYQGSPKELTRGQRDENAQACPHASLTGHSLHVDSIFPWGRSNLYGFFEREVPCLLRLSISMNNNTLRNGLFCSGAPPPRKGSSFLLPRKPVQALKRSWLSVKCIQGSCTSFSFFRGLF